jgi:NADH-quinone oxidoreductase subunit J
MELAFGIIAFITLCGAAGAVFFRNVMHCALSLILFFFGIAAEFFLLRADFIGWVQILVYAGAVGVLVLFALMLTRHLTADQPYVLFSGGALGWVTGFGTAAVVAGVLSWAILRDPGLARTVQTPPTSSVAELGTQLMTTFVIPLEVLAVLLTAAMIGAIVLALEEVGKRR